MTLTMTPQAISATRATVGRVVGVGVGAVICDEAGRVLLLRRGVQARNEQGMWACPGGALTVGESLQEAIVREVREECGLAIVVRCQLGAFDHLLPDGTQWVSIAYLAQVGDGGEPVVQEPGKCSACAWFVLDGLPEPLSPLAGMPLAAACLLLASAAWQWKPAGSRDQFSARGPGYREIDRRLRVPMKSSRPSRSCQQKLLHLRFQ